MALALVFLKEATLSRLVLAASRLPTKGETGGGEGPGEARGEEVKVRGEPTVSVWVVGAVRGCGATIGETLHDVLRVLGGGD